MTKTATYPTTTEELARLICAGENLFFTGSRTSTVVPYEKIENYFPFETRWVSLERMPKKMELIGDDRVRVSGAVNWQELRAFLHASGHLMLTSPTEELALVLSGLATSATGERAFGFGTLRDQVSRVVYMDGKGNTEELSSNEDIGKHRYFNSSGGQKILRQYQEAYNRYQGFKNGPFPRLEKSSDLMIGFEGQLGAIVEADLKVIRDSSRQFVFIKLPFWEKDDSLHLKLHQAMQPLRGKVAAFEILDWQSYCAVPSDKRPGENCDLLFIELFEHSADEVIEQVMACLPADRHDQVFLMPEAEVRKLRMDVPRFTFERNSQAGVVKIGTDAQVTTTKFSALLDYYRKWTKLGHAYNLFGHFGDSHLHFNFLPTKDRFNQCQALLPDFYAWVRENQGSPFAEHGIGVLKKKFISQFYDERVRVMFSHLKMQMDPARRFFGNGFMDIQEK
jgi:FAD/FMN-containing dehydrogenase